MIVTRDLMWQEVWHCVTENVTVTRDIAWQVTQKGQNPCRGVHVGCSCLASARTFTSPKWGFNRWQGGCQFHILPLGARLKSRGISEHSPVTSRAEAGSPEGTLPLEGVPLYLVIHRMHKPSNRVQMVANHHPPKASPMSELIYIDHFHYILHTPFFFYFLWYPLSVLHLNVAIIGCLRMRFWAAGWCQHN